MLWLMPCLENLKLAFVPCLWSLVTFFRRFNIFLLSDASLAHLIHKLKNSSNKTSKYNWQWGQLKRKGKLVIGHDEALREELLILFHNSLVWDHSGVEATMKRFGSVYY